MLEYLEDWKKLSVDDWQEVISSCCHSLADFTSMKIECETNPTIEIADKLPFFSALIWALPEKNVLSLSLVGLLGMEITDMGLGPFPDISATFFLFSGKERLVSCSDKATFDCKLMRIDESFVWDSYWEFDDYGEWDDVSFDSYDRSDSVRSRMDEK